MCLVYFWICLVRLIGLVSILKDFLRESWVKMRCGSWSREKKVNRGCSVLARDVEVSV